MNTDYLYILLLSSLSLLYVTSLEVTQTSELFDSNEAGYLRVDASGFPISQVAISIPYGNGRYHSQALLPSNYHNLRDSLTREHSLDEAGKWCPRTWLDLGVCPFTIGYTEQLNATILSPNATTLTAIWTKYPAKLTFDKTISSNVSCYSMRYFYIDVDDDVDYLVVTANQVAPSCIHDEINTDSHDCPFAALFISKDDCPTFSNHDFRQGFQSNGVMSLSRGVALSSGRYVIGVAADTFSARYDYNIAHNREELVSIVNTQCCSTSVDFELTVEKQGSPSELLYSFIFAFCAVAVFIIILFIIHFLNYIIEPYIPDKCRTKKKEPVTADPKKVKPQFMGYESTAFFDYSSKGGETPLLDKHVRTQSVPVVSAKESNNNKESKEIKKDIEINKILTLDMSGKHIRSATTAPPVDETKTPDLPRMESTLTATQLFEAGMLDIPIDEVELENLSVPGQLKSEITTIRDRRKLSVFNPIEFEKKNLADSISVSSPEMVYYWVIPLICALIAGTPILQFVMTESLTDVPGSICRFNNYCRRDVQIYKWIHIRSFNNVLSNLPFILGGLVLIIYARRNYNTHRQAPLHSPLSVYYGLALAIMCAGAFSSFYHMCPTIKNFQFDVMFQVYYAAYFFVSLYSRRHPAHFVHPSKFFIAFCAAVILNVIAVYFNILGLQDLFYPLFLWMWGIFSFAFVFSMYFYHVPPRHGVKYIFERIICCKQYHECSVKPHGENHIPKSINLWPARPYRAFSLFIFFIIHWVIIFLSLTANVYPQDTMLFVVGMAFFFYSIYYTIRKLFAGERPTLLFWTECFLFFLILILLSIVMFTVLLI